MKNIIILTISTFIITGCVSNKKYKTSQQKVIELTAKSNTLENKVTSLEQQIQSNKTKRIIKLPTGSPTVFQKRTSEGNLSAEDKAYFTALNKYKIGDTTDAIRSFESFNTKFPNSKYRTKVLYRLGQALYSERDFERSKVTLEGLIYQTPSNVSYNKSSAISLLKKVYKELGETGKIKELNSFSETLSTKLGEN